MKPINNLYRDIMVDAPHYKNWDYEYFYDKITFEDILSDPLADQDLDWLYKTLPPFAGSKIYEEDLQIMCFHLGNILKGNKEKWLNIN